MSVKQTLHEIVEQLDDEGAAELLALLRRRAAPGQTRGVPTPVPLSRRPAGGLVSSRDAFAFRQPRDVATLAAQQGVSRVENFDDLLGDFWPEDESVDDFIRAVRQLRQDNDDG